MEPQKKKRTTVLSIVAMGGLLLLILFAVSCGLFFPGATPATTPTFHPISNTQEPSLTETLATEEPTTTGAPATATLGAGSTQPVEHATLSLDEELELVQAELNKSLKGKFTYAAPSSMRLNESLPIELLLNPSLSAEELGTQIVESSGLVTSTADPGVLLTTGGDEVKVVANEVDITPLMKAVLIAGDPQAFDIQPLHENEIQLVGKNTTTKWQWLVTPRKAGTQKIILVMYRQVNVDNREYWPSVETYRADIDVNVTFVQRLLMLDWKWIAGILASALLIPAFWRWYDQRQKQNDQTPRPKHKGSDKKR